MPHYKNFNQILVLISKFDNSKVENLAVFYKSESFSRIVALNLFLC